MRCVDASTDTADARIDSPAKPAVRANGINSDDLTYGAELINSLNIIAPGDIIDNRDAWVEQWNTEVIK